MSGGASVRGMSQADVQALIDAGVPVILLASLQNALGITDVGAIGIGATKNVDVTIKPTMPGLGYTPAAVIIGTATLLGQLEILGSAVLSTSVVRVQVRNGSLIALNSGQVLVSAVRD